MEVVSNGFVLMPCLYGGGAERAAFRLASQLQFRLITLEQGCDYPEAERLIAKTFSKVDGRAHPFFKLFAFPFQLIATIIFLRQFEKPVVISFTERPSFLMILGRIFVKDLKLIVSFRNHQSTHLNEEKMGVFSKFIRLYVYRFMFSNITKLPIGVTVLSQGAKQDLVNNFGADSEKITVIYNEYNIEEITSLAERECDQNFDNLCTKYDVILNVGRLERQKGQIYMLDVFSLIRTKRAGVKFVILGVGSLQSTLKEHCRKIGLTYADNIRDFDADVFFLGFVNNPFSYIRRAAIFVFPSLWEGFGNALLEAMASGAPVFSADCSCGPREMISPTTGVSAKAKIPEYGEFGVLLPEFLPYENDLQKMREIIELWASFISSSLADKTMLDQLRSLSTVGAKRFAIGSQVNNWRALISQV